MKKHFIHNIQSISVQPPFGPNAHNLNHTLTNWSWVKSQIMYQGTFACNQNGVTIHLSLLLLVSLSLQLLRTPSHSWCNQRSVLPKFQCDEMICYTTKDHLSLQDQTACENTFHAFQYLSETQSCLWHLSSVLVCSCHNTPCKLHIDTIHYRWLPSHMHNIYHLL